MTNYYAPDFDEEFNYTFELIGTVFVKFTKDKNGNILKEVIDPEDLANEYYEQLEVTEYYKRK